MAAAGGAPLRLVHGCRFLSLPLLQQLPELLAPGGVLLWSTFLEPSGGAAALAPPYRTSRRLRRGQLAAALGAHGSFRVLHDSEGELITRGTWVPANFFIAERIDDAGTC